MRFFLLHKGRFSLHKKLLTNTHGCRYCHWTHEFWRDKWITGNYRKGVCREFISFYSLSTQNCEVGFSSRRFNPIKLCLSFFWPLRQTGNRDKELYPVNRAATLFHQISSVIQRRRDKLGRCWFRIGGIDMQVGSLLTPIWDVCTVDIFGLIWKTELPEIHLSNFTYPQCRHWPPSS